MNANEKNPTGREECPPERRRCPKCGRILAEANRGPECFACRTPKVIDLGKNGRIFKRPTTFKVIEPVSVCSSRETRGFNRVYYEYHGWGNGL